jgi:hypothetical protein
MLLVERHLISRGKIALGIPLEHATGEGEGVVFLIGLNEFFVFGAWDSLNPMGMAVNSHSLSPSHPLIWRSSR